MNIAHIAYFPCVSVIYKETLEPVSQNPNIYLSEVYLTFFPDMPSPVHEIGKMPRYTTASTQHLQYALFKTSVCDMLLTHYLQILQKKYVIDII